MASPPAGCPVPESLLINSMATYIDEGVCGPRGDDAVADLSPCRNGQTVEFSFEGTQDEPFLTDANGCKYSLILSYKCIPDIMSQITTLTLQKPVNALPDPIPAVGSVAYVVLAEGFKEEIENAILPTLDPVTQVCTCDISLILRGLLANSSSEDGNRYSLEHWHEWWSGS